jgi:RimJ/RimL family protein N-acetyltransferase
VRAGTGRERQKDCAVRNRQEISVENQDVLVSSRLRLAAMSMCALRSELSADGRLGSILNAEIGDGWPPEHWEPHVFELLLMAFEADHEQHKRHRYVLLDRRGMMPLLIGVVNGFVWPERPGEIEIGYSILPTFQRQGNGFEACECYVRFLSETWPTLGLMAQTYPRLIGSVRILERLGFQPDGPGQEEGVVVFRRPASGSARSPAGSAC